MVLTKDMRMRRFGKENVRNYHFSLEKLLVAFLPSAIQRVHDPFVARTSTFLDKLGELMAMLAIFRVHVSTSMDVCFEIQEHVQWFSGEKGGRKGGRRCAGCSTGFLHRQRRIRSLAAETNPQFALYEFDEGAFAARRSG